MELSKKDISLARLGLQTLSSGKDKKVSGKKTRLVVGADEANEINLPPQAVEALEEILEHLAEGREVTVSAQPFEYSTQKAAEFLRVSRPFLIGLLEKGEIPFRKVGTHRRVIFSDLQKYKDITDAERLKTLEELTKQAQELGLGY
ncbi:MAG: helix-turn-helix domain-containing protein [Aridibacter sp.]